PVLLHVLPRAGLRSLGDLPWTWDEMNAAMLACGSPHAALHLASRTADWDRPPSDAAVLARLIAGTRAFAEKLDAPLVVENVPCYAPGDSLLPHPRDPHVIAAVCERTGVGLLLDLAHARIAAHNRGEDAYAYLSALPLDRVCEVHVCGPAADADGVMRDEHQEMGEEDYAVLTWTLERTQPLAVTLEYGGTGPHFNWRSDAATLERQLLRLRAICAG
nr:DUF692 domain-containing protein [Chloroflexota bacterium]